MFPLPSPSPLPHAGIWRWFAGAGELLTEAFGLRWQASFITKFHAEKTALSPHRKAWRCQASTFPLGPSACAGQRRCEFSIALSFLLIRGSLLRSPIL